MDEPDVVLEVLNEAGQPDSEGCRATGVYEGYRRRLHRITIY